MKHYTKSLALFVIALSFPAIAFAELVSGHLPVVVTAENLISVFSVVSLGVIASADYSRRQRIRAAANRRSCGRGVSAESHRLAA